jgi:hypothetical protein
MTFPSKMPTGRSVYASAVLLEVGVIGLFASLLLRSSLAVHFGIVIVAGLSVFVGHVVWMLRRPVSRPAGAPRPDFGLLHAGCAAVSLCICSVIGLGLLAVPMSPRTLHAAAAYGVLGLLGFLGQMVVAMEARLLPMAAWFWSCARSGYRVAPPPPHAMRDRRLQAIVLGGWLIGVPALAGGLFLESARLVSAGSWSLVAAVAIGTLDTILVIAPAVHGKNATEPVRGLSDRQMHSARPGANSILQSCFAATGLTLLVPQGGGCSRPHSS